MAHSVTIRRAVPAETRPLPAGSRVRGFGGSRVRGFAGSGVRGFGGSGFAAPGFAGRGVAGRIRGRTSTTIRAGSCRGGCAGRQADAASKVLLPFRSLIWIRHCGEQVYSRAPALSRKVTTAVWPPLRAMLNGERHSPACLSDQESAQTRAFTSAPRPASRRTTLRCPAPLA